MKIGIYGGTFNPVHYGHLRTAQEVYERLSLDTMLFIPSGKTPFDKPDLARASDRYTMVAKAVRGIKHFKLSDIEIKTRGRSYSIDTVKKIARIYESGDLYFILGIDAFLDLPLWKEPDKLLEMTNLVIISRPGSLFREVHDSPYVKGISKRSLSDLDKGKKRDASFEISTNQRGMLLNVTGLNISSSMIRSLIEKGESISYLLPESVKSYIISHNLYKNRSRT